MKSSQFLLVAAFQIIGLAGVVDITAFSTDAAFPGTALQALGQVNNNGDLVGYVGAPTPPVGGISGFQETGFERLPDGTLIPINVSSPAPAADPNQTVPFAINDSGTIVGAFYSYSAAPPNTVGFVLSGGVATPMQVGGGETTLLGINDAGDLVGSDPFTGFIIQGGVTTDFGGGFGGPSLQAINNQGQTSGIELTSFNPSGFDTYAGFIRNPDGTISTFVWPATPCTLAQNHSIGFVGINDNGEIAGYCEDQSFNAYAFYGTPGNFTLFQVPGSFSLSTEITGINDSGEIVGTFSNGSEIEGFTAFITPEPSTLILAQAGFALIAYLRLRG